MIILVIFAEVCHKWKSLCSLKFEACCTHVGFYSMSVLCLVCLFICLFDFAFLFFVLLLILRIKMNTLKSYPKCNMDSADEYRKNSTVISTQGTCNTLFTLKADKLS